MTRYRSAVPTAFTVCLAMLISLFVTAGPARADVNVYTTPGYHTVNGRQWHTTCGPYSSVIDRCRADIWATQVQRVNGRYLSKTGWVFNNLTYLPAPRETWKGNPLATPGTHTISGRQWKTECDTAWTGKNACRSFIWATVIEGTRTTSGTTYRSVTKWVFNNIVLFSTSQTPSSSCGGAPLPTGFAITNGRPHATKVPYSDPTLYNPQNISNFIRLVLVDTRTTAAQKTCLGTFGGDALLAGSTTKPTPGGATARWFPYMFAFSANPAMPTLKPGWISGLAQGGALSAFSLIYENTNNAKWLDAAKQTFESYTVPLANGGFVNEVDGALWFEEYPTVPETTVLNGHLEAVIALDLWQRRTHEPRATALFNRAVKDLPKILPREEVPVSQGIVTSYDQVRGYPSSPLRLATGSQLTVQSASQQLPSGPKALSLPVQKPASDGANLLTNSTFSTWSGGLPTGWSKTLGSLSSFKESSGTVAIKGNGTGWQSLGQIVPAAKVTPGATYRLSWLGRTAIPTNEDGASGKVVVVAQCPSGKHTIGENNITRAKALSQLDMLVKVPAEACALQVLLYQTDWTVTNTTVYYDNVTLTPMQSTAGAVAVNWPLEMQDAPTSKVTLTTTGVGELQAYMQGRWWTVAKLSSTSPKTVTVAVAEQFTGRNLHFGYHETHVDELLSIYRRTADPVFLNYAQRWRPLAPSKNHLFANLSTFPYEPGTTSKTADTLAKKVDAADTDRLATNPLTPELTTVPEIGVPVPVSPTGVGVPAE